MNNTQLIGMRMTNEATKMNRTMTARQMALTAHRLGRTGEIATLANGQKFAWSNVSELWLRYE
jgi:hypothetical protein